MDRRQRRHHELAVAVQQARSNQIVNRSLYLIALLEVFGIVGELANDLLDRQLRRVQVKQMSQHTCLWTNAMPSWWRS